MAARSGVDAPLTARRLLPRPHPRRDRRRRRIGPVVEALEDRLPLSGSSSTNPVPIGPGPIRHPNPLQLGAAYQEVVVIQAMTLQSLGSSYREAQAAGTQFAGRTAVAIDELDAELRQVESRHEVDAIAAAVRRDRHLLNLGGTLVAREEHGLDVARGIADQQANTEKTYIPNGLFTNLTVLVEEDRSTNTAISRSGRRSEDALVRELGGLDGQLTSTVPVRPSVRILAGNPTGS